MVAFLAACIVAGTPLAFATIGELITEKSGSTNLGVEGMMLLGAVMGFITGQNTGNPFLAMVAAAAAGAIGALIFGFLTVTLRANQIVVGLTLTIFGTGLAQLVGRPLLGSTLPSTVTSDFAKLALPGLSKIPVIGEIFFAQDRFVYLSYVVTIVAAIYMYKTKWGRNMKAVGESNEAADASGINVTLYKYVHILIGGALCGLGGAYLSIVRIPIWQEDIVNGRGWIAVALVIFVAWNPVKGFFGSALFGGLSILGLKLQTMGFAFSQYLFDMIPYICTIVIVFLATYKNKRESQPPADLGNNYFREDR